MNPNKSYPKGFTDVCHLILNEVQVSLTKKEVLKEYEHLPRRQLLSVKSWAGIQAFWLVTLTCHK